MTQFEYVSVAISIVFSFAVLRLLDALPHAVSAARRYWIHGVWVAFLLWWSAVFWWLSWSHSARQTEFGFPEFLLLVTPPGVLYLCLCATALVSEAPAQVPSRREHFWAVRRRFFGLALILLGLLAFTSLAMQHIPLVHLLRVPQLALFGLFTTGFVSRDERTHGVVALLGAALALAMIALAVTGVVVPDLRQHP
jgi:hypothetical protein